MNKKKGKRNGVAAQQSRQTQVVQRMVVILTKPLPISTESHFSITPTVIATPRRAEPASCSCNRARLCCDLQAVLLSPADAGPVQPRPSRREGKKPVLTAGFGPRVQHPASQARCWQSRSDPQLKTATVRMKHSLPPCKSFISCFFYTQQHKLP